MSLSDHFIDSVVGVENILRPTGDVLSGWAGLARPDSRRGVRGGVAGVRGGEGDPLVCLSGVQLTGLSHVQRGQS